MATEQEKAELYAMDISDAVWESAPGGPEEEKVEIARLPGGAVAMRNSRGPRHGPAVHRGRVAGVRTRRA